MPPGSSRASAIPIADRVKIAGRRDPQANIFKLVHDWLCGGRKKWLLILDNVDDARFLHEVQTSGQSQTAESKSAARPLREYNSGYEDLPRLLSNQREAEICTGQLQG
ncbi:hypothetical protein GQ44DRAFT_229448 [Phaeosphaeriaceae sp. PMI808]|nr:hypothetical protein GQ44DRAFT_229448 [Phaeosphaeriaceae sp. PMI808]